MRYDNRFQAINFLKFVGLGIRRTSHSGQLAVQAEIVLKSDGRQRLVFWLDRHAFLGLHRLMQAIAPATTRHQAPGELIHNHNLAGLHHIMLVPVVKIVGTQGSIKVVHQGDVCRVVQRGTFRYQAQVKQNALRVFVTLFGQHNLMAFLVKREVAGFGYTLSGTRVSFAFLTHQPGNNLVNGYV